VLISGCVGTSKDNAIGRNGYDGSPMLGPNSARARIGGGAVVGANALVTKDVPDGALVMGVLTGIRRRLKAATGADQCLDGSFCHASREHSS
jgi:hypothetical protein